MKRPIVIVGVVLMVVAALSRKTGRRGAKMALKGTTG
jgi:hypothetical protein